MQLGLSGKTALVTGASKGIGRAIAVAFGAEGMNVAVTGRDERELGDVASQIERAGGSALAIAADVTQDGECERMVREAAGVFGTVHVLVNNAGGIGGGFANFDQLTDDDWTSLFNLNILSVVRITRAALPYMQKQRWGRVINIASESGVQPDAAMPHYNATKAALLSLTKSLSKQYGPDGILVNAVSPAFIKTPLVEDMLRKQAQEQGISEDQAEAQFLKQNRPNITAGRAGTVEESAAPVVFLASEAASFVNGSNYRVDSGSVGTI